MSMFFVVVFFGLPPLSFSLSLSQTKKGGGKALSLSLTEGACLAGAMMSCPGTRRRPTVGMARKARSVAATTRKSGGGGQPPPPPRAHSDAAVQARCTGVAAAVVSSSEAPPARVQRPLLARRRPDKRRPRAVLLRRTTVTVPAPFFTRESRVLQGVEPRVCVVLVVGAEIVPGAAGLVPRALF